MRRLKLQTRGRVVPRASIQGVRAVGAAQDLTKNPGDTLTVVVNWTNQTVDHQGNAIAWPFALRAVMSGPSIFQSPAQASSSRQPGSQTTTLSIQIPSTAPSGTYSVQVFLTADDSDSEGNPSTGFISIDQVTAADQVIIPTTAGPASPAGSINTINLSQLAGR